MLKNLKKGEIIIYVIALMLVAAGYLNYTTNNNSNTIETYSENIENIGDAVLVSNNDLTDTTNMNNTTVENTNNSNEVASSISTDEENEQFNTSIDTSSEAMTNDTDYFVSSKLERDTMYSQMLESYQKIIDSNTTTEKQKSAAQEEINNINKIKNAIMISENLIKTKGFEDVIIFSNDDSISVVIDKDELEKEDIAQIQSIIAREMNSKIDDIHIMNK